VPLALLFPVLQFLGPDDAFLGGYLLEHGENSRHHALESAEVHVRTFVHSVEHLIGVFLDLVLDVHFATLLVHGLTRESIVKTEVVGELCKSLLPVGIIEQILLAGDTKE
jgi:hypothetical protein